MLIFNILLHSKKGMAHTNLRSPGRSSTSQRASRPNGLPKSQVELLPSHQKMSMLEFHLQNEVISRSDIVISRDFPSEARLEEPVKGEQRSTCYCP